MKEVEIRLIKELEIPELAASFVRTFNQSAFGEEWTQESAEAFLRHFYKKQPDLFFVAVADGEIVGNTLTEITPWWYGNMMENSGLFVDPSVQKQGIAKKLLCKLLSEAISKYNAVMFTGITTTNAKFPLEWYERIGLKRTDLVYLEGKAMEVLRNLKA